MKAPEAVHAIGTKKIAVMTTILLTAGAIWFLGSFVFLLGLGIAASKPTPHPGPEGILQRPELASQQGDIQLLKNAA